MNPSTTNGENGGSGDMRNYLTAARKVGSTSTEDLARTVEQLRKVLEEMRVACKNAKDGMMIQRNVNNATKNGVKSIETKIEMAQALFQKIVEEVKPAKDEQNLGAARPFGTPKRTISQVEIGLQDGTPSKIRRTHSSEASPSWQVARSRRDKNQMRKAGELDQSQAPKTPKRKRIGRKPRRDTVLVKCGEGKTYADVLSKIKRTYDPGMHTVHIHKVRKTKSGDVLIEMGAGSEGLQPFTTDIKAALGKEGTVTELTQKASLEVRDLDDLTTELELEAAVKRELKGVTDIRVHIFEPNKYGQRAAVVDLEQAAAQELTKKGKLLVGMVYCRIRERVKVKRCYKCLGYGHVKAKCQGPDRSSNCWKCGKSGHQAKACQYKPDKPECFICTEKGNSDTAHLPGTGSCPVFRAELDRLLGQTR